MSSDDRNGGFNANFVPKDNIEVVEELPPSGEAGKVYQRVSDDQTFVWSVSNESFSPVGISTGQVIPIGGIMPYNEYPETEIPEIYVKCNGQTITDSDSPLEGQTAPDLNNSNRFLRGSDGNTGVTGGAEQVALSGTELASHDHQARTVYNGSSMNSSAGSESGAGSGSSYEDSDREAIKSEGGDSAHENRPPFFNVTYIMRVK